MRVRGLWYGGSGYAAPDGHDPRDWEPLHMSIKASGLQIGDIIRTAEYEKDYSCCTVYQIDSRGVHLIRPYVHAADFLTSSGVITYIGQEEYCIPADDRPVALLARRPPEETRQKIRAIVEEVRSLIQADKPALALEKLRLL